MKKKLFILILTILSFVPWIGSFAQNTLATLMVDHLVLVRPNILEFDLHIIRTSDKWEYWANGTFELGLDTIGYNVTTTDYNFELIPNSTDPKINTAPIAGQLPVTSYLISQRLIDGRISITVAGPEQYTDAAKVPFDTIGLRIGRFRLTRIDGTPMSTRLYWQTPSDYFQACAFKAVNDSLLLPSVVLYNTDDNIEMDSTNLPIVNYKVEPEPTVANEIINFTAVYYQKKQVQLYWQSLSEFHNKGYIVVRALQGYEQNLPKESLNYADTVADYRLPFPPHSGIVGLGTRKPGRYYEFDYDTVPYRGAWYCYKLLYQDFSGKIIDNSIYSCCYVPHAVIVQADNSPNPFTRDTKIHYKLDDSCRVSIYVYDLTGKKIATLQEQVPENSGVQEILFEASFMAQQGLYDIVIIAYPLDDSSIELSRAVIKAQLVR